MVSTPKPPPAPDPVATAAAQTQMNKETAISQTGLNAMNQYGPNGSLIYSQSGTWSDGTPKFSATQTLNPMQDYTNTLNNETQARLGQVGFNAAGNLGDLLASPYDLSQGAINSRTAGMAGLPSVQMTDPTRFATDPSQYATNPNAPGARYSNPNAPAARYTDAGMVGPQYTDPTMVGVQYADTTAPELRLTDATGPTVRPVIDPTLVTRQDIGSNDQLTDQLFAAGRSRLDPVLSERRDNAEALMANKGLTAGSTGYERGLRDVTQGENDAYNQLFLTGQQQAFGQSATRANTTFGQDLSRFGQFFDQSAQKSAQDFSQDLASRSFAMGANNQNFSQDLAARGYTRDTTNSNFAQAVQVANTARAANDSNFQQALASAGFGMAANKQNYDMDLSNLGYTANINQQNFGQDMTRAGFTQGVNAQNFGQMLGANGQNFGQTLSANGQNYSQMFQDYQAAMAQRAQALQEIQAQRSQPINEISALLSGSQVTPQNFVATPQTQVQPTNYTGLVSDIYKGQVSAYQAQNQASQAAFNGLGSIFGAATSMIQPFKLSDRRLKTDIEPLGRIGNGLRIYAYRMKWGGPVEVGVMAQEVAAIRPDAVMTMPGGWLAVDYARALEA